MLSNQQVSVWGRENWFLPGRCKSNTFETCQLESVHTPPQVNSAYFLQRVEIEISQNSPLKSF